MTIKDVLPFNRKEVILTVIDGDILRGKLSVHTELDDNDEINAYATIGTICIELHEIKGIKLT